jgi:microcystin-dependent protein
MWALNFAPRGWAFCDGQLLPIAQNTALFSLIGTTYGGDGRTTVGLPDLRGRAAMHPGRGPGLTARRLGEKGGATTATLSVAQMASHTHALETSPSPGEQSGPNVPAGSQNALSRSVGGNTYGDPNNLVAMASQMLPDEGNGQPHDNRQPYLGLVFTIALTGLYPSRS